MPEGVRDCTGSGQELRILMKLIFAIVATLLGEREREGLGFAHRFELGEDFSILVERVPFDSFQVFEGGMPQKLPRYRSR